MSLKVRRAEHIHIDEGEYTAVVASIQEKKGNWGSYFIWTFMVRGAVSDGREYEDPVRVTGLTSGSFSEKSKLLKWAKACGLDTTAKEMDLEEALNVKVRISITDDEDKEGRTWSKVDRVMRFKKAAAEATSEDEDTPAPAKKPAKKPVDAEEAEDSDEEAPAPKKKPAKPAVDADADEEDTPPKKPAKKPAPEPEEEEDDEEDEAPPAKAAKPAAKPAAKKPKDEEEDLLDFGDDAAAEDEEE